MMKKDSQKSSRRNIRTFEPDDDVEKMLEAALQSGATLKEITNNAIRLYGPSILKKRAERLRKQADELEKSIPEGNR